MHPVRRLALLVPTAALLVLTGCGSSLATRPSEGSPRSTTSTEARALTPFCEAVQTRREATEPIAALGLGQQLTDVSAVVDRIRAANQQVTALAPQEIRADFERTDALVEQQLQLLEARDGDTLAVARDPAVARARTDPGFTAASDRVDDYVRRTCEG